MKKFRLIVAALALLGIGTVLGWKFQSGSLQYVADESTFHSFSYDESGYVAFHCEITVRNRSGSPLTFAMKADMSKEIEMLQGRYAEAYDAKAQRTALFEIAPHAKQTYLVEFKALAGDKHTKTDRLPPQHIVFLPQPSGAAVP